MVETVETLAQRLTQLEEAVENITSQLSWIVNELEGNADWRKEAQRKAHSIGNNKQDAEVARQIFEQMGISGEPIPAEELQARMVRNGIPREGNEFSHAIIEEREK